MSNDGIPGNMANIADDSHKMRIIRELDGMDQTIEEVASTCYFLKKAMEFGNSTEGLALLQDTLPPHDLYAYRLLKYIQIWYTIREVLQYVGLTIPRHLGSPVAQNVIKIFYMASNEYLEDGMRRYQDCMDSTRRPTSPSARIRTEPSSHLPLEREVSKAKKATSLALNFKDREKFSGTADSSVSFFQIKRQFVSIMEEQEIDPTEAVDLIHHCLSGEARDYFHEEIRGQAMPLSVAMAKLERKFSSPHHHNQAETYLSSLTIQSIRNELNCGSVKAPSIAQERISNTIHKCGPSLQGDNHMSRMLARMVTQEPWAQIVLATRLANPDMDFHTFHMMLAASVAQATQFQTTTNIEQNEYGTHGNRWSQTQTRALVHYGSQYANRTPQLHRATPTIRQAHVDNTAGVGGRSTRHVRTKLTPEQILAKKANSRCANCSEIGHWWQDCIKPRRSITGAIHARVQAKGNTDKAAAQVLFQIAEEIDLHHQYTVYFGQADALHDPANAGDAETADLQDTQQKSTFDAMLETVEYTDEAANIEAVSTFDALLCSAAEDDMGMVETTDFAVMGE